MSEMVKNTGAAHESAKHLGWLEGWHGLLDLLFNRSHDVGHILLLLVLLISTLLARRAQIPSLARPEQRLLRLL